MVRNRPCIFGMMGLVVAPQVIASALPEGTVPETVLLGVLGRGLLLLAGLFLLVAGRRFERCLYGVLLLALSVAVGWMTFADRSYPLALLAAFALYATLALIQVFVPRTVSAAAAALNLAGLYGSWLLLRGDFGFSGGVAGILMMVGALLGAFAPGLGEALLAPSLGTLLAAMALPGSPSLPCVASAVALGFFWQALALMRLFPKERSFLLPAQERALRWRVLRRYLAVGGGAILAGILATVLLLPKPPTSSVPHPERLASLKTAGALEHPGILFSEEDALYLFGRPYSLSLLSGEEGFVSRLKLVFAGRSPSEKVHELRTVKSPGEIAAIRRACAITSGAFADVAPLIRPGATEADLERAILASFERSGATGVAFRSVVGAGPNATLPHYDRNDAPLKDGFIVLDIGCSYRGYAGDMTRTFSVTRKYSSVQRKLMEIVAGAHEAARKALKPGITVAEVDASARKVIEDAGFGSYFTHGIGHHVGLSVHDPHAEILQAGMVFTVEPGIYIPRGAKVDEAYWNLGVRIEDTYLITAEGCEALTDYPHIP